MSTARVLKPLFDYKVPDETTILVQKKGEERPTPISIAEYNDFFKTKHYHGMFYDARYHALFTELQAKLSQQPHANFEKYLQNPCPYKLSIRYVNETCQYGLFADEPIPPDTIIGLYGGEAFCYSKEAGLEEIKGNDSYDMDLYTKFEKNGKKYIFAVRALVESEISRFMLHLPDEADLQNAAFDPSVDPSKLFKCNIGNFMIIHKGMPINILKTERLIEANELLGFSYGSGYWRGHKVYPDFFIKEKDHLRVVRYDTTSGKYKLIEETIPIFSGDNSEEKSYSPVRFEWKYRKHRERQGVSGMLLHKPKPKHKQFDTESAPASARQTLNTPR